MTISAEPIKGEWTRGQKTGHWKPTSRLDDMDCICYLCSECQKPFPWKTNYCPNCGAKMEEDK